MPKLYFYDTGIVCHLLGIDSPEHASLHTMSGALFEGFLITELIKMHLNQGKKPNIYYWRDHRGLEIDAVLEMGKTVQMIEFKSSQTYHTEYLNNLRHIMRLSNSDRFQLFMVYGGAESTKVQGISVLGWREYLGSVHL